MSRIPARAGAAAATAATAVATLVLLTACAESATAPAAAASPTLALVGGGGDGPTRPQPPVCTLATCPYAAQLLVATRLVAGDHQVVLMTGTGSVVRQLTPDDPFASEIYSHAALSPDKKRVAYAAIKTPWGINDGLWIVNVDGTNRHRVSELVGDGGPSWSPDGTRLTFPASPEGHPDIFVVKADGTGLTRLTNDAAVDRAPAFTPDGNHVVFASDRENGAIKTLDLWRVTAAGTLAKRLTQTLDYDERDPSFSASGLKMVYARRTLDASAKDEVVLTDAQGANPQVVMAVLGRAVDSPSFSADGGWMAVKMVDAGKPGVYRFKLTGNLDLTRITPANELYLSPGWTN